MNESGIDWVSAAGQYEWMVPGRPGQAGPRWFLGGYSNVAINVVDRHLESGADRLAVLDRRNGDERGLTYRDLYHRSATLARWWQAHGLEAGDRVYLPGRATLDGLVAWLGAVRMGAVVVRDRAPLDFQVAARIRATEAGWAVVGDGKAVAQWEKAGAEGYGQRISVLCGANAGPDQLSIDDALSGAQGMLDPVPVEANTIGVLVYGDRDQPSAYSGVGSLLSWHASLGRLLSLAADDRVGLASDLGGLHDLLPLTLAVLCGGATVVWMNRASPGATPSGQPNKMIVTFPEAIRDMEALPDVDRYYVLGPGRFLANLREMPHPMHIVGDMTAGLYHWLGEKHPAPGPGRDRAWTNQADATPAKAAPVALSHLGWLTKAMMTSGSIWEACSVPDAEGRDCLWLASPDPSRALDNVKALASVDGSGSSPRIIAVMEFPQTIEGAPAVDVIAAITRGERRVPLTGLLNPEVVPSMVQAFWSS